MRNLIMGTATGYSVAQLSPFVKSARGFHPDDDIALIVNMPLASDVEALFKEYGVISLSFQASSLIPGPVQNVRYFRYADHILERAGEYADVFLADTRDLVFQGNVFQVDRESYLYCFLEDVHFTIGTQHDNANWIRHVYSDQLLRELHDKRIICWGTVLGDATSIMRFLQKYQATINLLWLIQHFERNKDFGHMVVMDQAIPTWIYYKSNDIGIEAKENGNIVGTLGLTVMHPDAIKNISQDADGILHVYGHRPAVIHQYDRNAQLQAFYSSKYQQEKP